MATVSVVDISITAVLGFMLMFAWLQNRTIHSIGWWGAAHLVLCISIAMLAWRTGEHGALTAAFGIALMTLSYGLMWNAARVFDRRAFSPLLVFAGPCGWLVAKFSGHVETLDQEIILSSALNAAYCFAAAFEYWRARAEALISRWPAILLLAVTGAGFLSWIPMTIASPFAPAGSVGQSAWFPFVVLVTLLGRVALAFIVLAMTKERLEMQQRTQALTDPLTGLPNRRAFFRAAIRRMRARHPHPQPMSLMIFDLDRFKEVNDRFGHSIGDRVLQLFAETLTNRLQATDIVGRLGGEEFVALLPSTDLLSAAVAAERVRTHFALSAVSVDDVTIGATVSIGVAEGVSPGSNLHAMMERADFALYAAKNAGRNRVEFASGSSRRRILPRDTSPTLAPDDGPEQAGSRRENLPREDEMVP